MNGDDPRAGPRPHRLARAVNRMDARAASAVLVTLGLLAAIVLGLLLGEEVLGLDQAAAQAQLSRLARHPLAPLGVVLVYCAFALVGFPQALLIAGTVAVFGPALGVGYAWLATMCSAHLTFAVGRALGASFAERVSAGRAASMMRVVRGRGAWASMIVRVVPSAPFVVVNVALGAAGIRAWKYALGTGVGVLPKMVFLAAFTGQADEVIEAVRTRNPAGLLVVAALVAGWIAFALLVRALYRRTRERALATPPEEA